jgi:hypothetical protein
MDKPFKPEELYFGLYEDRVEGCMFITLVPKEWWDKRGCLYEGHIKLEGNTVPWLNEEPDLECNWVVENPPHEDVLRSILMRHGYIYNPEIEAWDSKPVTSVPKCDRPTKPGLYLCQRGGHNWPETAQIREEKSALLPGNAPSVGLIFYSGASVFPLIRLEPSAQFWGPIEVEK